MATHYRVVDTWNGGAHGRVIKFTSPSSGGAGQNEVFIWILKHTPVSNMEAPRQGLITETVDDPVLCSQCPLVLGALLGAMQKGAHR